MNNTTWPEELIKRLLVADTVVYLQIKCIKYYIFCESKHILLHQVSKLKTSFILLEIGSNNLLQN